MTKPSIQVRERIWSLIAGIVLASLIQVLGELAGRLTPWLGVVVAVVVFVVGFFLWVDRPWQRKT